MRKTASTTVPVHPLLAERWSPRGFDQAHEIGDDSLTALLEAARWAPSAQNSQPWRFLVTRRGDEAHGRLFTALAPGNRAWAGAAGALILVAARTVGDDGQPQPWALYDTGQALAALRAGFGLDDTLTPVVIVAIGRPDVTAGLPGPLAARETAPRTRRPLSDLLLPAGTTRQTRPLAAA